MKYVHRQALTLRTKPWLHEYRHKYRIWAQVSNMIQYTYILRMSRNCRSSLHDTDNNWIIFYYINSTKYIYNINVKEVSNSKIKKPILGLKMWTWNWASVKQFINLYYFKLYILAMKQEISHNNPTSTLTRILSDTYPIRVHDHL